MLGEEELDVSSECSSGCQSGWTAYLDHSSCGSSLSLEYKKGDDSLEKEEEEEEDLSMVSDASSGPPHLPEQDELSLRCFNSSTCFEGNGLAKCGSAKKRRVEPEQQCQEHYSSLLDDTASSPLFSQPKAIFAGEDSSSYMKTPIEGDLEFSGGFSATHFKTNNTTEKQMGFLQSTSLAKPRPARPMSRKESGNKI
ncbi:protein SOB FIVE-LIKE 5-like [Curcuma longa]|uniref:protein SOB FIVE-LIKE 5-like n=1 Tax=Curcuma longa TaxID=136217 RepID=UPI003D9F590C